jgi:hypothetical protein
MAVHAGHLDASPKTPAGGQPLRADRGPIEAAQGNLELRRAFGSTCEVDDELFVAGRGATVVAAHHLDVVEPGSSERVQDLAGCVRIGEEVMRLVGHEVAVGPLLHLNLASDSSRVETD